MHRKLFQKIKSLRNQVIVFLVSLLRFPNRYFQDLDFQLEHHDPTVSMYSQPHT